MNSADDQLSKPSDVSTAPEAAAETSVRLSPKPVRPAETPNPPLTPVPSAPTVDSTSVGVVPSKPATPTKPAASSVVTAPLESIPIASTPEPVVSADEASADLTDAAAVARLHPIPPASEPMQYRAIGLVRGKYTPSEEQFTRGDMVTEDGTEFKAVLLGRVMSLVKKHLDLEANHLWVVYPRTRDKQDDLHVQIVGVWEPEKLAKKSEEESDEAESAPGSLIEAISPDELEDGYFSIRGEIMFHSEEDGRLVVRIQQSPKKGTDEEKSFKLNLRGDLEGKTVGYFWDLNVQRQGNDLIVQEGTLIGLVPPRKRSAKPAAPRGGRPGGVKKWSGPSRGGARPFRRDGGRDGGGRDGGGRDSSRPASPRPREMGAPSKPIIKRQKEE